MPSGEPCVILMKPPTGRSCTECSICAYAAESVEVKLPWYVAKRIWPIFSSTLILRSVASTHCDAAGERRRPAFVGAGDFLLATPALAADERFCVRAVWAIRKMNATETTNRTPTRPFLNCGVSRSRMRSLYITHAHHANNASTKGKFHNTIGACAKGNRTCLNELHC